MVRIMNIREFYKTRNKLIRIFQNKHQEIRDAEDGLKEVTQLLLDHDKTCTHIDDNGNMAIDENLKVCFICGTIIN